MRLFTSRYANRELADWEGAKIGITVGWPRFKLGYSFRMCKLLAPDRATFHLDREAFTIAYRGKLDAVGVETVMATIRQLAAGEERAVLLCFEDTRTDGLWCHRTLLAQWLGERGIEVEELPDHSVPSASAAKRASKPARAKVQAQAQQATFSWEVMK